MSRSTAPTITCLVDYYWFLATFAFSSVRGATKQQKGHVKANVHVSRSSMDLTRSLSNQIPSFGASLRGLEFSVNPFAEPKVFYIA